MEARRPSECGVLNSWNLFEVIETGSQHLVGYAPAYDFDIITDALAHFSFNRKSRAGRAITKKAFFTNLQGNL